MSELDPESRVQHCFNQLKGLNSREDLPGLMQAIVYGISALVHMDSQHEIDARSYRATVSMLETQVQHLDHTRQTTIARVLRHDLWSAASLAERRLGQHWMSTWALARTGDEDSRSKAPHREVLWHGLAIRHLRAANIPTARQMISNALELGPSPARESSLQLLLTHRNRISGAPDAAIAHAREQLRRSDLSDDLRDAFEWEILCSELHTTGRLDRLVDLTKPGRQFDRPSYFVEAVLLSQATCRDVGRNPMPKIVTRAKHVGTRAQDAGLFYKLALAIERCYDPTVPIESRIDQLGNALASRTRLITLDKEMLVMACALRWLVAEGRELLADTLRLELEAIGLRLTGGPSQDPMALLRWLPARR